MAVTWIAHMHRRGCAARRSRHVADGRKQNSCNNIQYIWQHWRRRKGGALKEGQTRRGKSERITQRTSCSAQRQEAQETETAAILNDSTEDDFTEWGGAVGGRGRRSGRRGSGTRRGKMNTGSRNTPAAKCEEYGTPTVLAGVTAWFKARGPLWHQMHQE
eukprot:scaffold9366_cov118-Isochrysis_galbana.AAC.9